MKKIYIVRHGQSEDNANRILGGRRDARLTELGRSQAKKTAQKLKNKKIDVIYSSPLRRAFETAQIITNVIEVKKIIKNDNLVERDMGCLTGIPLSDIKKYTTKLLITDRVNYFLEVDGAEDFPTLYKRAALVLSEIKLNSPNKTILIVTHSDIGKMMRAVHENRSWEEELRGEYFGNGDILELTLD